VVLVVALGAMAVLDGPPLVWLALLSPIFGVIAWIARLLHDARQAPSGKPERTTALWQRRACFAFTLLAAIPLPFGFHKFFWNDAVGRFRHAEHTDQLRARHELLLKAGRDLCPANPDCERAKSQGPYILCQTCSKPAAGTPNSLAAFLSGWMPVQND